LVRFFGRASKAEFEAWRDGPQVSEGGENIGALEGPPVQI